MPCRRGKGEHHILFWQSRHQFLWLHIIAQENNVFALIGAQRIQDRSHLRVARSNEDHIILILRCQFRYHRHTDGRFHWEHIVFNAQPVCFDGLGPFPSRKQSNVLPCLEKVSCQIAPQHTRTIYKNSHRGHPPLFCSYSMLTHCYKHTPYLGCCQARYPQIIVCFINFSRLFPSVL